jgi:hypothetical protein
MFYSRTLSKAKTMCHLELVNDVLLAALPGKPAEVHALSGFGIFSSGGMVSAWADQRLRFKMWLPDPATVNTWASALEAASRMQLSSPLLAPPISSGKTRTSTNQSILVMADSFSGMMQKLNGVHSATRLWQQWQGIEERPTETQLAPPLLEDLLLCLDTPGKSDGGGGVPRASNK